jgi:hypothetical protein
VGADGGPRNGRRSTAFREDRRGVSISVTHVLSLGITAVLVTGLLISANAVVSDQQDAAVRQAGSVVGERLADEFEQLDRIAADTGAPATIRTSHPDRIGGVSYRVSLVTTSDPACPASPPNDCLVVDPVGSDIDRVVVLNNAVDVRASTAQGGNVRFVYDGSDIRVEPEGV